MAQQPIYIEVDEELTEVVERMRRSPGSEVGIVVPPHSRLGQSRFNFQLLREYAGRMGKRVAIISSEPGVQALAAEHGFQSYPSVDRYAPVGVEYQPVPAPAPVQPAPTYVAPEPAYASTAAAIAAPVATPRFEPSPEPGPAPQPKAAPRAGRSSIEGFLDRDVLALAPNRSLLYGGAALVLIVGLVAMFLFVPSTTVTLTAQATAFSQAMDVDAAPGTGAVAVRTSDDTQQTSQQIKTTGLHVTPAQPATGQVVYTNNCAAGGGIGGPLQIPNGQRLDGGGQVFAQQGDVIVPEGGTAQANIIAVNPGVASNVPPHTINTIENAGAFQSCLLVDNPGATTGGAEKKQDPMLSQQDFDSARQSLQTKLQQKIHDDLAGQAKKGERLDDTVNYDTPSFLADHKVGDLVAQFTGSMTLKGEGAFYSDSDVRNQLKQNLTSHVPAGQVTTDNNIQTDYQVTQSQPGGHLTIHGTANAYIAPRLDFEQIKSQLAGKSNSSAQAFLRSLHVLSFQINQTPFPLPLLPLLTSRITVKYVVEQGSAAST
ncbi:MAG TPA: baseplate J/gp47 family protein [Candidatus Dormibacteraeota bacterium]